jgi:hypothetical protein
MKTRLILPAALAVVVAGCFTLAHAGDSQTPPSHKELLEKKIAKLPAQEQELARKILPLRDSLMRTVGEYQHKVHKGTAARSLTAERAAIKSLQSQIYALEAQNPDVTLDLLADLPGPGGFGHHGGPGHHGADSLAPPPPPEDD